LWRYEHLFGTEKPDCATAMIDADVVLAGPLADWLTRFNETTSGPAAMLLRLLQLHILCDRNRGLCSRLSPVQTSTATSV
jgi:hypothetical protein